MHSLLSAHFPAPKLTWWGGHQLQCFASSGTAKPFTTLTVNSTDSAFTPPPQTHPFSFSCLRDIYMGFSSTGIAHFSGPFNFAFRRLGCSVNHAFIHMVQVRKTCCILIDSGKSSKVWGFYELLFLICSLISPFHLVPLIRGEENSSFQNSPVPIFPAAVPLSLLFSLIWFG